MQPFGAVEQVKRFYQRFVETSFPLADEDLKAKFRQLVNEQHLLWQDPFVSLSRPFESGGTLSDLVQAGTISEQSVTSTNPFHPAPHWKFSNLHAHQRNAAHRLSSLNHQPQNTLIATGTGSGKTEAFLLPIVDHCLRQRKPGIQAVIVYPMNALVNDQLRRLRELLRGTGVTFARYTGNTRAKEAPDDVDAIPEELRTRRDIRKSPPQILLTNYMMLEFLLVRQADRKMFQFVKPQYLVLDEVHTYTGILGAEVACLIRRFKEHAGTEPGELCCIGTSATVMASKQEGTPYDPQRDLLRFASDLFGEDFPPESILKEAYRPFSSIDMSAHLENPPMLTEELLKDIDIEQEGPVRRLASAFHIEVPEEIQGPAFFHRLHNELAKRLIFALFERWLEEPLSLEELARKLHERPERRKVSFDDVKLETMAVLLLGSAAYPKNALGANIEPRFRPKVHFNMRSMTPLAMTFTIAGEAEHLLSEGVTQYRPKEATAQTNGATPVFSEERRNDNGHEQEAQTAKSALPLAVCRSCGTPYLKGYYEYDEIQDLAQASGNTARRKKGQKKDTSELPDFLHLQPDQPYNHTFRELYVLLLPQQRLSAEEAADVAPEDLEEGERFDPGKLYLVCPYCLVAQAAGEGETPGDMQHRYEHCPGKFQHTLPAFHGFASAKSCPVCRAQGRGRAARRDVITLMNGGAATSVSIITEGLLLALGAHEKRMLIFADSRQDTAHQAGYTRDRHQTFTQRQIVFRALRDYEHSIGLPIPLDKLHTEIYLACRRAWGSDVDAVNLLALEDPKKDDVIGFYLPEETVSKPTIHHVQERLEWDMHLEFTDRIATRNSLEREGLVTVNYSRLDELIQEHLPQLAAYGFIERDIPLLIDLVRAMLDYIRRKKAVAYKPFADYLSAGADSVRQGVARPNRYNKMPHGFGPQRKSMRGAYEVFSWETPGSTLMVLVGKVLEGWSTEKRANFLKSMTGLLIRKGYLRAVKIGQLSGGKAGLTTEAYQLSPKYLEVTTNGAFYRCLRCGDVRGYRLHKWGRPTESICPNRGCKGRIEPYVPSTENFYVQSYKEQEPERMYVVEHSGQLEERERERIEAYFKEGRINVIVCTPTLELGVDIGDLPALIMRNVPPSPSSYAQRTGRAGRERRIALSIPHAGQTPHDAYFFHHPAEMISGAIRTPYFLMDNEVVIRRHINSLILEKLDAGLPGFWRREQEKRNEYDYEYDEEEEVGEEDLVDKQGELQTGRLETFRMELRVRRDEIAHAVAQAFVREQRDLPWLDRRFVQQCCDTFVETMQAALLRWCDRYKEIYQELERLLRKVLLSKPELRRQRQLQEALDNLLTRPEYRPISFLASAGFLPRYGFTGDLVVVRNDEERQVSQVSSVGITEYALGNRVYVAGKKLLVNRVHFFRRSEDALDNAKPYKRCQTCSYMTTQPTAQDCPYCHELLVSQQYIDYEMVHGWSSETITQDDEYRQHETYDCQTYLGPLDEEANEQAGATPIKRFATRELGRWKVRYSHLREITIFNRGRTDAQTGRNERFQVCLECGAWMRPLSYQEDQEVRAGQRQLVNDHLYSCPARGDLDAPAVQVVDLKVRLQGDVVEIDVPPEIAGSPSYYESWKVTFQQALKLGLQLEYFTGPREIESFDEVFLEDGQLHRKIVFYDTMPGGTGYLRKFYEHLPHIAQRSLEHMKGHGQKESCTNACYACLKEFWNQRWHGLLDKKLVYDALEEIMASDSTGT